MAKKFKIIIILIILISIMSMILLFIIESFSNSKADSQANKTSPSLDSNFGKDTSYFIEKSKKLSKLSDTIDNYIYKNEIEEDISIYIYEFSNDYSYKFNVDENSFAASIYKVPLAMLYYEKIDNGELSLNDKFLYEDFHYESGGPIGDDYTIGSYITTETLLHSLIIHSDNTAAHILFENLGGWINFKQEIAKYSKSKGDNTFFSTENILTANYMNDVMKYLYNNQEKFELLIIDMKQQVSFDFLSKYVNVEIAQKYGRYGNFINSVGVVFGSKPYSIVIFSSLGESGAEHISKINEICYTFFNSKL